MEARDLRLLRAHAETLRLDSVYLRVASNRLRAEGTSKISAAQQVVERVREFHNRGLAGLTERSGDPRIPGSIHGGGTHSSPATTTSDGRPSRIQATTLRA